MSYRAYYTMYMRDSKGGKYHPTYIETNQEKVWEDLTNDLLHKKIHKCLYIERITDTCLYNGYRAVNVYYNNNTKREYIIPDR